MPFYPNDMLTSAFLIGAINDKPSKQFIRQNYRGLTIFPWEEVPERRVIWDVMESENTLAGIYDPRGQAIPGDEVIFSSDIATLADLKASRNLESWSVQQLRDPGMPTVYKAGGSSNTVAGIEQRLRQHISKRLAWSNEAVDAQIEYLAMHALQGTIVWPPVDANGNAITPAMPHWNASMVVNLSTGLPANQNQAATTLTGYNSRTGAGLAWTNASATPFNDFDIVDEYMVQNFGISMEGGTVLMSRVVLGYMSRNTDILNWVAGVNKEQPGARGFAPVRAIKDAVQAQFGWSIETYDSQWTYRTRNAGTKPTINRVSFLTEGKIVILPPGGVAGRMMTAPQESAPGGKWVFGKMGWKHQGPKPPFDIELGVNVVAWPRFDTRDWFVIDVYN